MALRYKMVVLHLKSLLSKNYKLYPICGKWELKFAQTGSNVDDEISVLQGYAPTKITFKVIKRY